MRALDEVRPAWAEINLDNLAHNIKEVRKNTREGTLVTAVVKANAYGHGSIKAAETFLQNGGDRLAVATLSEGIEIRNANIDVPILILGYTPQSQFSLAIKYDITQAIYNYESAKSFSEAAINLGKTGIIHLKIDSGMGRIGFLPTDESMEQIIKISKLPNIKIEGAFTHFATADEADKTYTRLQYKRFSTFIERIEKRGISIPIKHISNSAAIIDFPEYNLDMVRAGIILYGFYPSDEVNKNKVKLKPAMNLKAKISNIKTVTEGTGISYGQIFVTKRKSKIATIPIGYADGFTRLLTSKGEVYIKGKRAPIVGKICMDQCMIDVTDIEDVAIGDEVILFGYEEGYPHVNELAETLGTINYEIVCMVGRRVPRVYFQNGEIIQIDDYLLK
ncbi:alanine racemase [Schnuerera sp. xch1]|uniref:alanine racemase n=1 Tax=Schnuerera sp. xch1 TaxID=2874283 RepID=UPI001CC09CDF|nr:alanine racemase [Schnuerera sp. xch1]MBZ2176021.1 alanine racemase [Schnuerera sp. xch1]